MVLRRNYRDRKIAGESTLGKKGRRKKETHTHTHKNNISHFSQRYFAVIRINVIIAHTPRTKYVSDCYVAWSNEQKMLRTYWWWFLRRNIALNNSNPAININSLDRTFIYFIRFLFFFKKQKHKSFFFSAQRKRRKKSWRRT